ncbi:MAG: helix-turn-helix domain-containing protein [Acidobacteriota bacterium]
MKYRTVFLETGAGGGRLRADGRGTRRVCTVAEACQVLQRSRRQVYRYLESGDLVPAGKVLGRWLVERDSVERLSRSPMTAQPMPSRLQRLFPEHDVAQLNVGRDRDLILSRVLEAGSLQDAKWALQRYGAPTIARYLEAEGSRQLSPRSLRLWSLYLGVRPRPTPPWRGTSPWHDR